MCVSACVCVCERVRGVGWKLLCSSRDRTDPWTRRKDGDRLTDQQRRLLPAAAPGLDGFAAGAPSNSGAAQEPPEVTRGFAEEERRSEPRARSPLPSRGCAPATGIYALRRRHLKLLGFLRRALRRGGTVWRRDLLLQSLDLRRRWKFSPSSWSCPSVGLEPGKRRLQIQSFISVRGCCVCWCCWTLFQLSFATFSLLPGFPPSPPRSPAPFYPLLACSCLFVCSPLIIAFYQDLRRPLFPPTAPCKGFLSVGYVRALDLEVLRG